MKEQAIKTLIESRSEAIHAKEIDRLMSHYSSDIIYFDVVPPLVYVGTDALRTRFLNWFAGYESGIRQEVQELYGQAQAEIAFASMLIRSGGTLKGGRDTGLWVRVSNGFQLLNDKWLITHEHVSVPADLKSGRAIMDIEP